MNLKYFTMIDSDEELKAKRNKLVKQHHPDKAPEHLKVEKTGIMQRINQEYQYVLNNRVKKGKTSDQLKHDQEIIREAAQRFFHALTSSKGVDIEMLISALEYAPDYFDRVCDHFRKEYNAPLVVSIAKAINNTKLTTDQTNRLNEAVKKCKIPKDEIYNINYSVIGKVITQTLFKNLFK